MTMTPEELYREGVLHWLAHQPAIYLFLLGLGLIIASLLTPFAFLYRKLKSYYGLKGGK